MKAEDENTRVHQTPSGTPGMEQAWVSDMSFGMPDVVGIENGEPSYLASCKDCTLDCSKHSFCQMPAKISISLPQLNFHRRALPLGHPPLLPHFHSCSLLRRPPLPLP